MDRATATCFLKNLGRNFPRMPQQPTLSIPSPGGLGRLLLDHAQHHDRRVLLGLDSNKMVGGQKERAGEGANNRLKNFVLVSKKTNKLKNLLKKNWPHSFTMIKVTPLSGGFKGETTNNHFLTLTIPRNRQNNDTRRRGVSSWRVPVTFLASAEDQK